MDPIDGIWWLATHPQMTVAGTLHLSDAEMTLELIGRLPANADPVGGNSSPIDPFAEEIPIILGTSHTGIHFTLYRCRRRRSMVSLATMTSFGLESYGTEAVFVGGHFASSDAVRFHRFQAEYSYLPEWVGMSGFRARWVDGPPAPFSDEAKMYEIVYAPPDPIAASISQGHVVISASMRGSQQPMREVTLRQRVWCEFSVDSDLTYEQWLAEYLTPFQQLLGLATSQPNKVVQMQAFSRSATIPWNLHQLTRTLNRGKPIASEEEPILIHTLGTMEAENEPRARLDDDQMLFRLSDILQELGAALDRWFVASKELDSVYGLYFSVLSSSEMGEEQRFLNLVQAAESYHRRRFRNAVMSEGEHRARVTAVLTSAPQAQQEWLEGLLKYSNEPRLKMRLKDLLEMAAPALGSLTGESNKKRKDLIQRILDTRNYLTHYDETLATRAARGKDLERLSTIVMLLVQVCFLRELGLPPSEWKDVFARYRAFRNTLEGRTPTSPL